MISKILCTPTWLENIKGQVGKRIEKGNHTWGGIPLIKIDTMPDGVEWMMFDNNNKCIAMKKDGKIYELQPPATSGEPAQGGEG